MKARLSVPVWTATTYIHLYHLNNIVLVLKSSECLCNTHYEFKW